MSGHWKNTKVSARISILGVFAIGVLPLLGANTQQAGAANFIQKVEPLIQKPVHPMLQVRIAVPAGVREPLKGSAGGLQVIPTLAI